LEAGDPSSRRGLRPDKSPGRAKGQGAGSFLDLFELSFNFLYMSMVTGCSPYEFDFKPSQKYRLRSRTRREPMKKRSIHIVLVCEHFEEARNAVIGR
jgi:hypothetical protein